MSSLINERASVFIFNFNCHWIDLSLGPIVVYVQQAWWRSKRQKELALKIVDRENSFKSSGSSTTWSRESFSLLALTRETIFLTSRQSSGKFCFRYSMRSVISRVVHQAACASRFSCRQLRLLSLHGIAKPKTVSQHPPFSQARY